MDIYTEITNRIIAELENGRIPWQKPWTGMGGRSGAWSRSTGKAYSLINQFLLGKPGEYLTFNQCKEAGGKVRKGEKSSMVVFWKMHPVTEKNADGEEITKTVPVLRYFNVFHVDQCDGIEAKYQPDEVGAFAGDDESDRIIDSYVAREGIDLSYKLSDKAYYSPSFDCVVLPMRDQFPKANEFYSTAFHELTHSTGHAKRLNRITKTANFGTQEYSKEELVAEIGACSILNRLGLETESSFRNSTAYIQSWLRVLKNDSRMIVSAASKAEKAVALIMGENI